MAGINREAIQKQIHQDWANREYIEVITASIKRITDFLNAFGKCSSRKQKCVANRVSQLINFISDSIFTFLFAIYFDRYVLPITTSAAERETDGAGASY